MKPKYKALPDQQTSRRGALVEPYRSDNPDDLQSQTLGEKLKRARLGGIFHWHFNDTRGEK